MRELRFEERMMVGRCLAHVEDDHMSVSISIGEHCSLMGTRSGDEDGHIWRVITIGPEQSMGVIFVRGVRPT